MTIRLQACTTGKSARLLQPQAPRPQVGGEMATGPGCRVALDLGGYLSTGQIITERVINSSYVLGIELYIMNHKLKNHRPEQPHHVLVAGA